MPSSGEKRWIVTDAAGRRWALSCGGGAGGRPSTAFDGVTARLIDAAFTPWGIRDRWLAKTLLAIHAALTGERARLTENDRDADWAHRVHELRESFRRKTWTGRLLVEPVTALRVPFEEAPPDTVRNVVAPVAEDNSTFELLVVDEAGEPIGGIDIAFSVDGKQQTIPTSGAGIARLTDSTATFGSARIVSPAAVREILEPRRDALRPLSLPQGEHTTIRTVRDLVASVSLEAGVRRTLAVVPNHRRVRLVGMHFDTNKSFLLPSAMHGIRELTSIYRDSQNTQFLVVGHTDARGTREYNNKLALERARSIVAFMKDDADAWNALFSAPALEKRWGDREVNAMLSALPEGGPPFTSPGPEARDPRAIKRFQQFSNDTRGTALDVDGKAGPETKRALIAAYMALDHTSLPKGATIVAHGCWPNHPPPDDGGVPPTDDERRRVDVFAFDGAIRPPPPGETSGPGSPEYRQWVAQMQSTFDVRTEVLPFRYAMQIGEGQQWSEAARLTMISEDLIDVESFVLANGESAGTLRIFEFSGIRPGIRYRADVTEGELAMELFAFTELHAVARDDSATNHLRPAPASPAAPFDLGSDPDDHGILEVRLFDADGNVMKNTAYRLSVGDQNVGYAENGVASIRLPPSPPPHATLEWGELDDRGVLPYRMEVALDCDDQADRTSSMLHNLGYPRSLPLETRVRAFQARHPVGEAGLAPGGLVPPGTRAEIGKIYRQKAG